MTYRIRNKINNALVARQAGFTLLRFTFFYKERCLVILVCPWAGSALLVYFDTGNPLTHVIQEEPIWCPAKKFPPE